MPAPLLPLAGKALLSGIVAQAGSQGVKHAFKRDSDRRGLQKPQRQGLNRAQTAYYQYNPTASNNSNSGRQGLRSPKSSKSRLNQSQLNAVNSFASGVEGNAIGSMYTADPVMDGLDDSRLMQDPGELTREQQKIQRQQMAYENQMGRGNTAFNAGLANAGSNATMRRAMARDAQLQRSLTAQAMMNNVSSTFGNTLQQSTNAMANVLSSFR